MFSLSGVSSRLAMTLSNCGATENGMTLLRSDGIIDQGWLGPVLSVALWFCGYYSAHSGLREMGDEERE